jgi:hypothetical protein
MMNGMMKGCWQMVFQQQQKEAKQLLDGIVSSMMEDEKDDGVEGDEKC